MNIDKLAINWQNFARVRLHLNMLSITESDSKFLYACKKKIKNNIL